MNRLILISVFVLTLIKCEEIGSECKSPVKCLDKRNFTFCYIVDGKVMLQNDTFTCPENYECVSDPFVPCAEIGTTTTDIAATTQGEIVLPVPICNSPSKYPGPRCNQYYECIRILWWFELKLKTCWLGEAFDKLLSRCVPIFKTNCVV